jgi:hypothetical protein
MNSCHLINHSKGEFKQDNTIAQIMSIAVDLKATVQWIPAHIQIAGNELADQTAKKVQDTSLVFEIIDNDKSFKDILLHYNQKSDKKFQSWYEEASQTKGKIPFLLIPKIKKKPWYYKKKLNVNVIKTTNRCIANHAFNNKYLNMIKLKDYDKCEICDLPEDVEHSIFICRKYDVIRERLNMTNLNNFQHMMDVLGDSTIEKLSDFVRISKIQV